VSGPPSRTRAALTWRRVHESSCAGYGPSTTRRAQRIFLEPRRRTGRALVPGCRHATFSLGNGRAVRVSAEERSLASSQPTMATGESKATRATVSRRRAFQCRCNGRSARCWSDLIAPSGLSRDRRRVGVREVEDGTLSVKTVAAHVTTDPRSAGACSAVRSTRALLAPLRLLSGYGFPHFILGRQKFVREEMVHRQVWADAEELGSRRRRPPTELAIDSRT